MVLLVEDSALVSEYLCRFLQDKGYLACPYDSGDRVIEERESLKYDIAIIDRSLEGFGDDTSGDDVARKLKEKNPNKPIVIISCYKAINFDCADYYLRKPFRFEELLEVLKQARVRFFGHTLEDMADSK